MERNRNPKSRHPRRHRNPPRRRHHPRESPSSNPPIRFRLHRPICHHHLGHCHRRHQEEDCHLHHRLNRACPHHHRRLPIFHHRPRQTTPIRAVVDIIITEITTTIITMVATREEVHHHHTAAAGAHTPSKVNNMEDRNTDSNKEMVETKWLDGITEVTMVNRVEIHRQEVSIGGNRVDEWMQEEPFSKTVVCAVFWGLHMAC
mmetsp:Transcript_18781/g.43651  ORF Transcript_18781/g.43651 Transcript_18781/m.43651 type:complete len:203 (-) Transcript_18781:248-856(-)